MTNLNSELLPRDGNWHSSLRAYKPASELRDLFLLHSAIFQAMFVFFSSYVSLALRCRWLHSRADGELLHPISGSFLQTSWWMNISAGNTSPLQVPTLEQINPFYVLTTKRPADSLIYDGFITCPLSSVAAHGMSLYPLGTPSHRGFLSPCSKLDSSWDPRCLHGLKY